MYQHLRQWGVPNLYDDFENGYSGRVYSLDQILKIFDAVNAEESFTEGGIAHSILSYSIRGKLVLDETLNELSLKERMTKGYERFVNEQNEKAKHNQSFLSKLLRREAPKLTVEEVLDASDLNLHDFSAIKFPLPGLTIEISFTDDIYRDQLPYRNIPFPFQSYLLRDFPVTHIIDLVSANDRITALHIEGLLGNGEADFKSLFKSLEKLELSSLIFNQYLRTNRNFLKDLGEFISKQKKLRVLSVHYRFLELDELMPILQAATVVEHLQLCIDFDVDLELVKDCLRGSNIKFLEFCDFDEDEMFQVVKMEDDYHIQTQSCSPQDYEDSS